MNWNRCEIVTDRLPEYELGVLDEEYAAAVRRHLSECAACAVEHGLIAKLRQHRPAPGEALMERIVTESLGRAPSQHSGSAVFRESYRWSRQWTGLAATVAMALLGGTLLLNQLNLPAEIRAPNPPVVETEPAGAAWFGVDAALVSGAASLQDLTVEELEQLLAEVDS